MPAPAQRARSACSEARAASAMTPACVLAIFSTWQAANPEPRTELHYSNPFELLVAVLLSAQATDRSVNQATPALFAAAPTPQAMLALGQAGIEAHIRRIGLYHSKARHLVQTCAQLIALHGGQVPRERSALQALPGVGRKTANVVLNVAWGEPTLAVDTHIFRLARRTGLAQANTPLGVEQALLKIIPDIYLRHAHHWMILHGRYVCTARAPHCAACAIARWCNWPERPHTNPGADA